MGEFIERRREYMIVEYEHMQHLKLLTNDEIKEIRKKRDTMEFKIERQTKSVQDYIAYISYENDLLDLIKERRNKLKNKAGWDMIEGNILTRIKYLYTTAIDRFKDEYKVFHNYLVHCRKHNMKAEGSSVVDKLINFHADKINTWILAVKWELENGKNLERIEHFIMRGRQRHPNDKELILFFFEVLLQCAQELDSVEEEKRNEIEFQKMKERIKALYDDFQAKSRDIEFCNEFLLLLTRYEFIHEFSKKVFSDMQFNFPSNEILWNTVAQYALEGSFLIKNDNTIPDDDDVEVKSENEAKVNLLTCIKVYKKAVEMLKTEKMWTFYIDAMLELNQNSTSMPKIKRKALGEAFKGAYEANKLSEEKYVEYLKLLLNADPIQSDFLEELLDKGTTKFPMSSHIWECYMTFYIRTEKTSEEIQKLFTKGVKRLQNQALPLWKVLLQYFYTRPDLKGKVEQVYREAINQKDPISKFFQPKFIEYLTIVYNIEAARKEYNEISKKCTPCLEIHEKMAFYESLQMSPDIHEWRMCHENATNYFGKDNVDVWINYIKFEKERGNPKFVQMIYRRAESLLDKDFLPTFYADFKFLNV